MPAGPGAAAVRAVALRVDFLRLPAGAGAGAARSLSRRSAGVLSERIVFRLGWRSRPWLPMPRKFTSATAVGSIHFTARGASWGLFTVGLLLPPVASVR